MSSITIAIDTLGGDHGAEFMVMGIKDALERHNDVEIIVTGDEKELNPLIEKYNVPKDRINIIHTSEVITCHDAPVDAIRKKKDSSLVVALNQVKEGNAQAIISSGNSGAILAGGQFIVGRAKGVKRTPLAPLIPTRVGSSLLVDCGANVDCKPIYLVQFAVMGSNYMKAMYGTENLVQFAKMGSIYMENIVGIKNPKVGIINIGVEDEKGNALVKETIPLLKECKDINFIGSVESREIPHGIADVLVCEAFTGNVLLKFFEGVGNMFMAEIKETLMSSVKTKIGAALINKPLKARLKRYKADDKGGAPLLGLKGLVVKIHGNSKQNEVSSAITQCRDFVKNDVSNKIVAAFEGVKEEA